MVHRWLPDTRAVAPDECDRLSVILRERQLHAPKRNASRRNEGELGRVRHRPVGARMGEARFVREEPDGSQRRIVF